MSTASEANELLNHESRGATRLAISWWSRRTRFQLTPLMDLLLIIVFAQFLDVREVSQQQSRELANEREKLQASIQLERAELAGIRQSMQSEITRLERERDTARASRDQAMQTSQQVQIDTARSLELLSTWFKLSPEQLEQIKELPNDSADEAAEQARRLAGAPPDQIVRFLISHAELLKRAEIWTVHAGADRKISIEANDSVQSFRLESKTQGERVDEAADRLFAAYKQLPQVKGLVIVLVSYDPLSIAGVYQPMVDAIPKTLERLRADSPQSRFEYTVLGAAPDPFTRR